MIVPVLKDIEFIDNSLFGDDLGFSATAYISEENDHGADCFHFQVLSLNDLAEILKNKKTYNGRATIIINDIDWVLVEKQINLILEDCIRPTWDEVANAINRYLSWEYDNIHYETLNDALKKINKDN